MAATAASAAVAMATAMACRMLVRAAALLQERELASRLKQPTIRRPAMCSLPSLCAIRYYYYCERDVQGQGHVVGVEGNENIFRRRVAVARRRGQE